MTLPPRRRASRNLILAAAFFASLLACADGRAAPGDELRLAIILTRHGVRSPLQTNEALAPFASQPWPKWEVAPGIQTPRGNALIALMGDYYRDYLADAGALSGDPAVDGPRVFIRADNDQRTIETGRIIGKSLVRAGEPDVHSLAAGVADPLFRTVKAHVGHPDPALAAAAILGRMGGDPRNVERAYATQFAELKAILYGPGGPPPGASPFDAKAAVVPGESGYLATLSGPMLVALQCTEALILEYADGMALSDVGWGRVDDRSLTDMLALHEAYFDLTQRTHYTAQVQGSNLASHIIDTMEQAALGQPVPGALGPPGERVVVIVGHDTNIDNIGGLFGLNWWIPGSQEDPVLPGGALIFELWRRAGQQDAFYVRTSYVAQTLAQMRGSTPLSLGSPPARSPIFVPGSSGPAPGFDAPLPSFVRMARRVIDPAFVADEP
jgi:4-phytase/acid phosphatase